jgi:3-deoxy-D-manno-octulosonic-acid transferase
MEQPGVAYRLAIAAAAALAPAAAAVTSGKVRASLRARRGVVRRIEAWARAHRDPQRPLLWVHAPSVGEGLQARAVLDLIRRRHPGWQVAYTHFSPSAQGFAHRLDVDLADYLPWDTAAAAQRTLAALRPAALVFTKLDVWPALACAAAGRGIPVGLVAGTVSPVSSRLRQPARALLRPGYAALGAVGAIAAADAGRLRALGTRPDRIEVLGDPRFDSVLSVIEAVSATDPLLRFRHGPPLLVAGSTWPADEEVLLRAFHDVRRVHPGARLLVAAHEPTPRHLVGLRAAAKRAGLPQPVTLDDAAPDDTFIIVDRVGALATLYGAGALAYVGGGFGSAGLHSVLEPAGWGLPVAFGPRWQSSREAGLLREAGGAESLGLPDPVRQLGAWWSRMLSEREERERMGRAAAAVIDAGRGAAERQAAMIERLVERSRP